MNIVIGVFFIAFGLAVLHHICKLHDERQEVDTLQQSMLKLIMGMCWVAGGVLLIIALIYLAQSQDGSYYYDESKASN